MLSWVVDMEVRAFITVLVWLKGSPVVQLT